MPAPEWFNDASRHVLDAACVSYLTTEEGAGVEALLGGLNYFSAKVRENQGSDFHWLMLTVTMARVVQASDPETFKPVDGETLGLQVVDHVTDQVIANPDARARDDRVMAAYLAAMRFIVADANGDMQTSMALFQATLENGTLRKLISSLAMMAGARMVERMYQDGKLPAESVAILESREGR